MTYRQLCHLSLPNQPFLDQFPRCIGTLCMNLHGTAGYEPNIGEG